MIESVRQQCSSCNHYSLEESYCRKQARKKLRNEWCQDYKIRLADSYAESIWSKWKDQKLKEQGRRKGK